MRPHHLPGFLAGLAFGILITAVIVRKSDAPTRPAPATPTPAAPAPFKSDPLVEENRKLREEIAELKKPKKVETAPEAPAEAAPDLAPLFKEVAELGLAGLQGEKAAGLLGLVTKSGNAGKAFLAKQLRSEDSGERFLAAAFLEHLKDASAVPELVEALRKEQDLLVRRMLSHALAVIGTEGAETALRSAMTSDADWGVRVNSAYGVAKLGRPDGLKMLEEAYASSDTPAEYRLAILYGLVDVAAPTSAPLFRKILSDTKDIAYLLASIQALSTMKDSGSLGELDRLATSELPSTVRDAARKAADAIRK